MEAYKTTCEKCGYVRTWVGYKTGIGKTPEQLEQMRKDETTCVRCGSTEAKTDLDHESEFGRTRDAMTDFAVEFIFDGLTKKGEDPCSR